MKLRAPSGESFELAMTTLLALSGVALVYSLLYLYPVGYVYFISEDHWAEYATFVGWAMAFCFLTWTLVKERGARTPGLFLLALALFFVAGEEISWGQRILGFRSPEYFAERNIKGETNIHNITAEGYYFHLVVAIAVLLWSVLLPVLTTRSDRLRKWCGDLGIPVVPVRLWPFFLVASYLFTFPSLKKSEVAEVYLSIGVAALSLDLALTARRGARARDATEKIATPGMVLTLVMLTAALVRVYPWPEPLKNNLNRFANFSYPAEGMHRQAGMLLDYMHRNPQFLTADATVDAAVGLARLGDRAEARRILKLALAEQERLQRQHPDHPVPYRIAGQLLVELDRPEAAERAFLDAVGKDRARLDRANDPVAKSWVHVSLAETLVAKGDSVGALEQLSIALALAPDQRTQWQMERLVKRQLKRRVVIIR